MERELELPLHLLPAERLGELEDQQEEGRFGRARWYLAKAVGDGLVYRFPKGALAKARYLVLELLLDHDYIIVFDMDLKEGDDGRTFTHEFAVLNQCQTRVATPLEMVNQNRFHWPNVGPWLCSYSMGDRVDLAAVDRMVLRVARKSEGSVRWCVTPVAATAEEPEPLTDPLLPKGVLVDELGQSTLDEWQNKSHSVEEVTLRLHKQLEEAATSQVSAGLSRWGGWKGLRFDATGSFRTHHDGRRWWLVDPDGFAFWSVGADCVTVRISWTGADVPKALAWVPDPEGPYKPIYSTFPNRGRTINYQTANLIRAFGPQRWYECWAKIALAELRRLGFNTFGNWSEWQIAREAGFPYVLPMQAILRSSSLRTPRIYRDFPDVFDPRFAQDAASFAQQLEATANEPAMVGYFIDNEPTWAFASETPGAGMLFNASPGPSRNALSEFLRRRYSSDKALSAAWGVKTTFQEIAQGQWRHRLNETAAADLAAFSTVLVRKLYDVLSEACRKVDPNHLNLGVRYQRIPPQWAVEGVGSFDVFTINSYSQTIPEVLGDISATLNRPIMVTEWGFGALDAGTRAAHLQTVRNQRDRGRALRVYTEGAAAKPWCVGVHWYQFYDGVYQNYGFLDVCHRAYEPMVQAARASHGHIYDVAVGKTAPYSDAPEYLPALWY
jgi:hypothetical protein